MGVTREQVVEAVFALLRDLDVFKSTSRRLRLWSEVPPAERPAAFLIAPGDTYGGAAPPNLAQRTINLELWVYVDAKDPAKVGAQIIDDILDKLDAALDPAGADLSQGLNTLGGLVQWCRINGNVLKSPGDLDGDGILIVPIEVLVP